jgi:hypothetical protein
VIIYGNEEDREYSVLSDLIFFSFVCFFLVPEKILYFPAGVLTLSAALKAWFGNEQTERTRLYMNAEGAV